VLQNYLVSRQCEYRHRADRNVKVCKRTHGPSIIVNRHRSLHMRLANDACANILFQNCIDSTYSIQQCQSMQRNTISIVATRKKSQSMHAPWCDIGQLVSDGLFRLEALIGTFVILQKVLSY
jgi:hypothetical protein